MKNSLIAVVATAALVVALSACGSTDGADSGGDASATPTGPLAGSEFGLAEGSTTEVPFDDTVLSSGAQEDLSTPATVLSSGITPEAEEIDFVAELQIDEASAGDIDDFDLDPENLATVGDATPYYITYTARYVNGPVAQQPDTTFFDVVDASGQSLDSGVTLFVGTVPEGECEGTFTAEAFGEGAETRGCAVKFLNPGDPAYIQWTYPAEPNADNQVSWPIN